MLIVYRLKYHILELKGDKKVKKYFLSILVIVFLFCFITTTYSAEQEKQEQIEWVTQTCHQLVGPLWDYVYKIWADKVIEMSGGRMSIDMHATGEIVPGAEVFSAVRDGILDAGVNSPGYQSGKFPASDVLSTLPGGLLEFNDLIVWYYGGEANDLAQEMYGDDVIVFPLGLTPPETFWTNKKIETLDDLKGVKFRSGGIAMEFWDEVGASVMMIPGGEIVPGLQRKLLDATDYLDPYMDYSLGLHEVADYIVGPPLHMTNNNYQLIINPKSWEELPDDLKAIVKNAATAATIEGYAKWWIKSAEYFQKIVESGVTPIKLGKEEQVKSKEIAEKVLLERAKENEFFMKVWKSQRDLIEKIRPYYDFTSFD